MTTVPLGALLEKYKNIIPKDQVVIEEVVKVLSEMGIPCDEKDVELVRGTVYIQTDSLVKSRIFIKREEIKKRLEERLKTHAPESLR